DLLRRGISLNTGPIRVPDQPSNAIFVFSIAEAIRAVLLERTTPNIYTLISLPAWSFAELVEWHARKLGLTATVTVERVRLTPSIAHAFSAFCNWIKQGVVEIVDHYKELLSAIVSTYSEE